MNKCIGFGQILVGPAGIKATEADLILGINIDLFNKFRLIIFVFFHHTPDTKGSASELYKWSLKDSDRKQKPNGTFLFLWSYI